MSVLPFNNLDEQLARFYAAKKTTPSNSASSVNKTFTFKSFGKLTESSGGKANTTASYENKNVESAKISDQQKSIPNLPQSVTFKRNDNFSSSCQQYTKTSLDIRNYFSTGESSKIQTCTDFVTLEKPKVKELKPTKPSKLFSNAAIAIKENATPNCPKKNTENNDPEWIKKDEISISKLQNKENDSKLIPEFQDKNGSKKYSSAFLQETNIQIMTKICDILEVREDILQKHVDLSNLIALRKKILRRCTSNGDEQNGILDCNEIKNIKNQASTNSEYRYSANSSKLSNNSDNSIIIDDDDEDFVIDSGSKKLCSFSKSSVPLGKSCSSINSASSPGQDNLSFKSATSFKSFQASEIKSTSRSSSSPSLKSSPYFQKSDCAPDNILKDNSPEKYSFDCKPEDENVFILNQSDDDILDNLNNFEHDIIDLENEPGTSYQPESCINSKNNGYSNTEKIIAGKFYGTQKDDGATQQYKGFKFPFSGDVMSTFQNVFGLKQFRHNQLEAINASLLGEDCFILMPTGGGKSLCYQLPALVSSGVTIVISPLRSLIMDQVQKLCSLDIPASSLTGDADAASVNQVFTLLAAREPGIKLLYVTPEKISASAKLMSCLESLYSRNVLQRFVIDEAHCVSQWGHDFRPDYKRLKLLREKFPKVPLMALTATATQRVRGDILHQLGMKSPKWFLQSFNRPNLKYEVRPKTKGIMAEIIEMIQSKFRNMCGIIYCLSRNDCDNVATILKKSGIRAASYHAGINNRDEIQEQWINDRFKVICATIAFGMGIDKPDVRFVIHHAIPKSIEGYYQESGRAGRDGERSWCILYYAYKDMQRIKRMVMKDNVNTHSWSTHFDNLFRMVHYCENKTDCRRVWMLGYFGEIFDKTLCLNKPETSCDNCYSKEVFTDFDVTDAARDIVQCVTKLVNKQRRQNFTLTYFVDIYKGAKTQKLLAAGHDKLELYGKGQSWRRSDAERLLRKLVLDQYLQEDMIINKMDLPITYIYPGRRSRELLAGKAKIMLPFQESKGKHPQSASGVTVDKEMQELAERCYNELIEVSKAIASERNMHYTNVINVEALRQMSREMPMMEEDMRAIPHVTSAIYEKYGNRFLEVTQRYAAERCVIDAERADKEVLSACVEDIDDWSETEVTSVRKGVKRKAPKAGGKKAKKQKNFFVNKKFQKAKNKGSFSGYTYTSSKKKVAASQNKAPVRMPGFMPNPKAKAVTRSFLSTPRVYIA